MGITAIDFSYHLWIRGWVFLGVFEFFYLFTVHCFSKKYRAPRIFFAEERRKALTRVPIATEGHREELGNFPWSSLCHGLIESFVISLPN